MFTDYWVIAQLLAQGCTLLLLFYASVYAYKSLRYWVAESDSALQIQLERQNYLMSVIMQVSLWFQAFSLLMFLHTVNDHLPPLIKGAMCATGTLGINDWGYPLLGLKSIAIFIYAIYLFINYLDNQQPAYPLTPQKYVWLYPALGISVADLYVLIQYFAHIKPDLIATCCSVDFGGTNRLMYGLGQASNILYIVLSVWVVSFGLLCVGWVGKVWEKYSWIGLLLSICYVFASVYVLKYHFVKYIYGLPSHLCLFDIFWGRYYAVGYVLFGAYYGIILSMLGYTIIFLFQAKLAYPAYHLQNTLRKTLIISLLTSFILPIFYRYAIGYNF